MGDDLAWGPFYYYHLILVNTPYFPFNLHALTSHSSYPRLTLFARCRSTRSCQMKPVISFRWFTALLTYILVQNALAIDVNPEDESKFILIFKASEMTNRSHPRQLPSKAPPKRWHPA